MNTGQRFGFSGKKLEWIQEQVNEGRLKHFFSLEDTTIKDDVSGINGSQNLLSIGPGKVGNCAISDGDSNKDVYIEYGLSCRSYFTSQNHTCSFNFWFKFTGGPPLRAFYERIGGGSGFYVLIRQNNILYGAWNSGGNTINLGPDLNIGQWYNVSIITQDNTHPNGSNIKVIFNNLIVFDQPEPFNYGSTEAFLTSFITTNNDPTGSIRTGTSTSGGIDQVSIWNVDIEGEITTKLYNNGNGLKF